MGSSDSLMTYCGAAGSGLSRHHAMAVGVRGSVTCDIALLHEWLSNTMCSSRIILTLRETGLSEGAESWSVFSSHPRLEEIQVLLSLLSSRVTGVYLMFVKTSSIRVRRNSQIFHVTESRGEVSLRSYLSRSSVLDIFPIWEINQSLFFSVSIKSRMRRI